MIICSSDNSEDGKVVYSYGSRAQVTVPTTMSPNAGKSQNRRNQARQVCVGLRVKFVYLNAHQ